MHPFAIQLDDRMLSLARAGQVMSSEPSGPIEATERLQEHLLRRIAEHPLQEDERVWVTSPASADARTLSTVVDALRGIALPVDGFVDAAAVAVAGLAAERHALVLELGLHHVAVTAVERGAQARRRRAVISDRGGLVDLHEAWLNLISTAMVKRARFDPLRNAETEIQMRTSLPRWLEEFATAVSITASATLGQERFDVELSRDQFASAAQPVYREILRLLHELRPAGAAIDLIMPRSIASLPAMRDALQAFVGCELVTLPEGYAAAVTSLLDLPQAQSEQSVRLLRRLPVQADLTLSKLVNREPLGKARSAAPVASHLLYDGRAHALTSTLAVGRAPGGDPAITLPEGLAGVSRRHCTFVHEGGELLLVDHSTFGTFLNGERISERARAYAGDKVRIGEPGVELSLITLT